MAKQNVPLISFNRGIISSLALARTDVRHVGMAAETQTNFMPRTLGSMMLRPGTAFVAQAVDGFQPYYIPFVFNNTDTAIIELTSLTSKMRVYVNEALVGSTDPTVSTSITNGEFTTDLSSWTSADQAGATSSWVNDGSGTKGYMSLVGTGFNAAIRKQTVTVISADQNKVHRLTITVGNDSSAGKNWAQTGVGLDPPGMVRLRIGSADGKDDFFAQTDLAVGYHSIAFTPTGNFYLQVSNATPYAAALASIEVGNGSAMALTIPYVFTSDLANIRWDQSADVIFLACDGFRQQRIERRNNNSWSIVNYYADDGPFMIENVDNSLNLTPSALAGDITITANTSLFYATHVGALFSITSTGQTVSNAFSGQNQFSNAIEITGVGGSRQFAVGITGTWSATITVQQSIGSPGAWVDYSSYTTNQSGTNITDGLDNQIVFYRIGIKTGNYTSGTPTCTLQFAAGSITGIARVTKYTSATQVSAAVLKAMGGTAASVIWSEGAWSDYRGWPTADALFEGRLWWAGRDNIWGSVSDAYDSFDDTTVGDSGPIDRTIGSGPVDVINWILPLIRMMLGGQAAEHSVRSSALDSPLTPTDFSIRTPSTQGSTNVAAAKIDTAGVFVNKTGSRLIELGIENAVYSYDYQSKDLTLFCPELTSPGIARLAVQRTPDTRIHCVLSDGTAAVLVYDPLENVQAWVKVTTNGTILDVFVFPNPGSTEDKVYYLVKRFTSDYFLERWALESECIGGTLNKNMDCHMVYSGSPVSVLDLTALPNLALFDNRSVVVWGDGIYQGTFTVHNETLTLPVAVSNAVVGLGYTAQYKSTKLAYAAQAGTALTQKKQVTHLGLIAQNMHYQAVKYGKDFNNLRSLPAVESSKPTPANTIWSTYDNVPFDFSGDWDSDSRLCLQVTAPLPVTLLAAIVGIQTDEEL